ncbi:hypothetical protein [Bacillus cereus group sp. BfR-BA-01360]|uniref:hypothetical protein n=1 Tax=Bacillus cereus group sp. BfR-BA-01360 TaxID=2920321 RepID=UPI001F569895|nr:hypothetical protein [Bacillus cereus group sp. BfR-BA-01360]
MSNQILEKRIDALEKLVTVQRDAINELVSRVSQLEERIKVLSVRSEGKWN